jgi:hypothetical protein
MHPLATLAVSAVVATALLACIAPALAQPKPGAAAGPSACSLLTRADVEKATGRNAMVDAESSAGGTICHYGTAQLIVRTGPKSWESLEDTLKAFKHDKEPRQAVSGFGDRAYMMFPTPANKYQDDVALLVTQVGAHTLALTVDAPDGKRPQDMRPAVESLMRTALSRLR